jgi:hypothetical protein
MGSGVGGCRRRAVVAEEVRRGVVVGTEKRKQNGHVQMQERVCGELQEEGVVAREEELASRREAWRLGRRRRNVERQEQASARPGRQWARRRRARGTAQSGAGAAGAQHRAGVAAPGVGQRNRGGAGWR